MISRLKESYEAQGENRNVKAMRSQGEWLRKLTLLNPAINSKLGLGNKRFAPHKPLLLLCVLELAEQGGLDGDHLRISPDLILRFQSFWKVVINRWTTKPDLRLPFHHLSTQGFWKPLTNELRLSRHRSLTDVVAIEPSFLTAIGDPAFRKSARAVLISCYFPPLEQVALCTLTGINEQECSGPAAQVRKKHVNTLA